MAGFLFFLSLHPIQLLHKPDEFSAGFGHVYVFVPYEADTVVNGITEGLHDNVRDVGQRWGGGFQDKGNAVSAGDHIPYR